MGSSIAVEEGCSATVDSSVCAQPLARKKDVQCPPCAVPSRANVAATERTILQCFQGIEVQSVVLLFPQSAGCSSTCLMRRKKEVYLRMCAGNERKLQMELGGSLTFYQEIMYTEKANSVSSCVFGQTHENMINAAQKGVHSSDHQYRDRPERRNRCTKISRSGMKKKLRVVRG